MGNSKFLLVRFITGVAIGSLEVIPQVPPAQAQAHAHTPCSHCSSPLIIAFRLCIIYYISLSSVSQFISLQTFSPVFTDFHLFST
ncbi:hypothetical protein BZA77DRAFT_318843 [Pyronema omphalodes]|nr:hypothetical protein BZA77DRAFT_318843 [Pyronema omphalodes]